MIHLNGHGWPDVEDKGCPESEFSRKIVSLLLCCIFFCITLTCSTLKIISIVIKCSKTYENLENFVNHISKVNSPYCLLRYRERPACVTPRITSLMVYTNYIKKKIIGFELFYYRSS